MPKLLLTIFLFYTQPFFSQQEKRNIPVRFSAGAGFYYQKNENVSFLSFATDFKLMQFLPISIYTSSEFHRDRRGTAQLDETSSQFGVGITRFGIKKNTVFFDPFVYAIYERRYLNASPSKYFGMGINLGFKTGYRFRNFALCLNINSSISAGRLFIYNENMDKNQEASWGNHFLAPTPYLTLSWTL